MKKLNLLLTCLLFVSPFISLQAQDDQQVKDVQILTSEKVEVYYFHNTRRCATCQAVEEVTIEALKEYYPEQMKSGTVSFQSLNLEEDVNEPIARELRISGQTLLIIKNGEMKDLTNDAFMYATSSPDKLKTKIQKAIGTI